MDNSELQKRLLGVGEQIKAKGWESASIDIYVSYLAIFDRPPAALDPMISCRPSISVSTRDRFGVPSSHQFVCDAWDIKTMEDALAKLEATAESMPHMQAETDRIETAKAKLSADERRLLGIR